ncbi:hypothetical protein G9A89_000515 [Geosiphon pyriformis]|nr:hypothetical protein G9A89_000515 [Geosiphon pyriformis]
MMSSSLFTPSVLAFSAGFSLLSNASSLSSIRATLLGQTLRQPHWRSWQSWRKTVHLTTSFVLGGDMASPTYLTKEAFVDVTEGGRRVARVFDDPNLFGATYKMPSSQSSGVKIKQNIKTMGEDTALRSGTPALKLWEDSKGLPGFPKRKIFKREANGFHLVNGHLV